MLADLQGIESNLEFVFRRDVLRAHGLPEGRRQVKTSASIVASISTYDAFGIIAVEIDDGWGIVENRFGDFERQPAFGARCRSHSAMAATTSEPIRVRWRRNSGRRSASPAGTVATRAMTAPLR